MDIEQSKEICKEIIRTNMFNRHTDAYAIETVLNELEKKDKIIELMAKEIASYNRYEAGALDEKEEVIKFYTYKVEKEGK